MTTSPAQNPLPIRNAATVIVARQIADKTQLLMGQRGSAASFMPDKFVFPGGATDAGDDAVPLAAKMPPRCQERLGVGAEPQLVHALQVAALRELAEETGLLLGAAGPWQSQVPRGWERWCEAGLVPDASALRFVYRAITPPNMPRRFDARFFLVDAGAISGDLDDLRGDAELSLLQWVPLDEARKLNLPFITTRVLAELNQLLDDTKAPRPVPFFYATEQGRVFDRID